MSAWYVFSALGLYPTVPTRAELALTTPLFPRAVVHLASGRKLRITAPRTDGKAIYIRKLTLNGKTTTRNWLPASTISTGGKLSFTLATTPSLTWGNGQGDAPPQN
jgi:putative alpha-1,2-mannosidase